MGSCVSSSNQSNRVADSSRRFATAKPPDPTFKEGVSSPVLSSIDQRTQAESESSTDTRGEDLTSCGKSGSVAVPTRRLANEHNDRTPPS